jgi:hypothetical protein
LHHSTLIIKTGTSVPIPESVNHCSGQTTHFLHPLGVHYSWPKNYCLVIKDPRTFISDRLQQKTQEDPDLAWF